MWSGVPVVCSFRDGWFVTNESSYKNIIYICYYYLLIEHQQILEILVGAIDVIDIIDAIDIL